MSYVILTCKQLQLIISQLAHSVRCKAMRVASEIRPLELIQISVVIEWVANSSLPSRHHPLCWLHFPSALAINIDSFRETWDLFLAPSWWVRRIQLFVVERV